MFNFGRRFLYLSLFTLVNVQIAYADPSKLGFGGPEHVSIGDQVALSFDLNQPAQTHVIFHLPNGLNASYGDILAFGDFYGVLGEPISLATSDDDAKIRFIASFHAFALNENAVAEAEKILTVLHESQKTVREGMERGEEPEKIFDRISPEAGRKLNCITGGGCSSSGWWLDPGRYLLLANEDFDHFNANAWRAFDIGHQVALDQALKARRTQNIKDLEIAYAMNAFASHFLSDLFASGHIRTPRLELYSYVSPALTGSLLSAYMHAEENAHGLHVHNLRGDGWIAYGDHYFFCEKNKANKKMLEEALQQAANEVFDAYAYGIKFSQIKPMIPEADEINNAANRDISPMFYWDSNQHKLMRRVDLNNLYDRHWTANWWGWSTLALLRSTRGLPSDGQARLAWSKLQKQEQGIQN